MSAKRLEAIVPQSRELLLMTTYSADAMFANDLFRRMQLGLDFGGLYGTGSEFMPLGIAYNKEVENIDATKLDSTDLADANGKITADFPVHVAARAMAKNIADVHTGWLEQPAGGRIQEHENSDRRVYLPRRDDERE